MHRFPSAPLLLVFFFLQSATTGWSTEHPVHLGILAQRPKIQMQEEWQPFVDYLSSQLPDSPVQLHVLDHQEMLAAMEEERLDFVLTNPSHYIFLREKNGLSGALATMARLENDRSFSSFGGVICTRKSRDDIRELKDIKGKKVASVAVGTGIFGSFQMQALELRRAGISLKPQQLVTTGLPLDLVIQAVLDGKADVGFVRTGLIEQLERQGKIPPGELKIINRQAIPAFPYASSTPLYPEWPFVALPHVDARMAAKVATALLSLEPGSAPLQAANIHGFVIPADYRPVENLLRELRLPPFDTEPQFTILDIWKHYWVWVVSLGLTVLVCIQQYAHQLAAKRRIRWILRETEQQQVQLREAQEATESANRALRLISASNRALLRSTNEEEQLLQVCRIAVDVGGYRTAWIGLARHDEEKSIIPLAWFGIEDGLLDRVRMSWGEGERGVSAMGTAIRTGAVQVRQDILNDPSLKPWHEQARTRHYRAAVAMPLQIENEVVGALAIYASDPNAFQEDEVELLLEMAQDLAFGIQTIRMRDARDKAREHVHRLAYYDRLTGLPNRFLLHEHLKQNAAAAIAEKQKFALLRLDLHHLREFNETYGHALGDQIIEWVARQLQLICGKDCFVARFGGDDFTVVCPEDDPSAAILMSERMLATISAPFYLSGHRIALGGSIGGVMYPCDGEDPATLLSKVTLAASRAKESGGGFCFYRPEMGENLARSLDLAARLEHAIQENTLELFFQPKVDLVSERMVGAEALLRWQDPESGWISPAEFIPIAESRGMMLELGNWVLRTAGRTIRQWLDAGLSGFGRIAVNISARQLESPDFFSTITGLLEETGITADYLELELTESILMADPERANSVLNELKQQGFTIAIDDFGTGYSSLSYLKRFSVDTLKIDRAFVRDMLHDQNDRAIVATIVAMAKQLGLTTVAEGVEEEGQHLALQQLGCLQAQGYHFSRPEPAAVFRKNRLTAGRSERDLRHVEPAREGI